MKVYDWVENLVEMCAVAMELLSVVQKVADLVGL